MVVDNNILEFSLWRNQLLSRVDTCISGILAVHELEMSLAPGSDRAFRKQAP